LAKSGRDPKTGTPLAHGVVAVARLLVTGPAKTFPISGRFTVR